MNYPQIMSPVPFASKTGGHVPQLLCGDMDILTRKVGQTEVVFAVQSGFFSKGLCMHDYKSLCAAVTICTTLVNIQTDRQNFDWLARQLS